MFSVFGVQNNFFLVSPKIKKKKKTNKTSISQNANYMPLSLWFINTWANNDYKTYFTCDSFILSGNKHATVIGILHPELKFIGPHKTGLIGDWTCLRRRVDQP